MELNSNFNTVSIALIDTLHHASVLEASLAFWLSLLELDGRVVRAAVAGTAVAQFRMSRSSAARSTS